MSQIYKNTLTIFLILFFLTACEEQLSPDQVATGFWTAMKNEDTQLLKKLIDEESAASDIQFETLLSVAEFKLGKIIIDGTNSEIETEVTLTGDEPVTLPITTYLLKENNIWKVDYKRTVSRINAASEIADVLNNLSSMSELFVDELNQSMEKMEEVLPKIEEGLSEFEQDIKSRIPEIREKLDEFKRKLEEALKKKEEPVEEETIEI